MGRRGCVVDCRIWTADEALLSEARECLLTRLDEDVQRMHEVRAPSRLNICFFKGADRAGRQQRYRPWTGKTGSRMRT